MTVSPSLIPSVLFDGPLSVYVAHAMILLAFYIVLPIVTVFYLFRAGGYYFSRFGNRWGLVALVCCPASLIVAGLIALIRRDDSWLSFLWVPAVGLSTFVVGNVVLHHVLHQPGWWWFF